MNPIVVLLSDCCNSPIRYGNSPHEGKTNYHVCTKCNNACNLAPPPLHPEITDADLGDNMLSAWNEPNGVQACIEVAIEYAQAYHNQQLNKLSTKIVFERVSVEDNGLPAEGKMHHAFDNKGNNICCNRVFMESNPKKVSGYLIESKKPLTNEEKRLDEEIKDTILKEYAKGNIVVMSFEGLQVMSLGEFIKQPADGMLYDLNRNEAVVLTFIKDPKWVNDYAVAKVIKELKRQLDETISSQKAVYTEADLNNVFEASRKKINHPDFDYVYETFEEYLKATIKK